jgi:Skp family chaperone for outer membrane proteins
MKKFLFVFSMCVALISGTNSANAQTFKVGVFDIDLMVQAMPQYHIVDSMVQQYEIDSLGAEYTYNQLEFARLDSTYKSDSALAAQGKKSQALVNFTMEKRRETGMKIVYWQQYAQNKSNNKRGQLAQPLYAQVINAYKAVLARKKYDLILKPQTYEAGFSIDNIFISVARELKLAGLPQELLGMGDDPGAVAPKQPAAGNVKPKPKQ